MAVGLNVGATAPLKLPDNSSILSYAPLFAPSIALEKKFIIHRRLYALAGLRFEYKGMKARAAVKNFHTEVPQRMDDQILIFAGAFTGENVTRVVGSYISIPIRIGVQITKGYSLEAGGFVALAVTRIFSERWKMGISGPTRPTRSQSLPRFPLQAPTTASATTLAGWMPAWSYTGRTALGPISFSTWA